MTRRLLLCFFLPGLVIASEPLTDNAIRHNFKQINRDKLNYVTKGTIQEILGQKIFRKAVDFKLPSSGTNNAFRIIDSAGNIAWSIDYTDSTGRLRFDPLGGYPVSFAGSHILPDTDNSVGLGKSGSRFTEVWAVNGTIQTSDSSQKKDIVNISTNTVIPRGVKFKWKTGIDTAREHIGFLADGLPLEAHPKKPDGTYDMANVYMSSVIGILCSKLNELQARLEALEKK
jgi:hypothetical protein